MIVTRDDDGITLGYDAWLWVELAYRALASIPMGGGVFDEGGGRDGEEGEPKEVIDPFQI